MSLPELKSRMAARVEKKRSGCHEWAGAKNGRGYGVIRYQGRPVFTHRAALAIKLDRPDLLERIDRSQYVRTYVLHSCDNPACVNPSHLRLGSAQDNGDDKKTRQRQGFNANLPRKFIPEQIIDIRREAVTWDGMCDMMKKYRASQATIMEIVNRKTYKHVP